MLMVLYFIVSVQRKELKTNAQAMNQKENFKGLSQYIFLMMLSEEAVRN